MISKAGESLARGQYFEAEALAERALGSARQESDFQRMAEIISPLQSARQSRLQRALKAGKVTVISEPIPPEMQIKTGCYLIGPPQVGADARRLRLAALSQEVPVAVLCYEPLTKTKLLPVVAVGSASIIRTKVPPPQNAAKPDLVWYAAAMSELGDSAIANLDAELAITRRIDALLEALNAIPEHENLHRALHAACLEAHRQQQVQGTKLKSQSTRQDAESDDPLVLEDQ